MTDTLRDRIAAVVEATIKRGTDCEYGPRCSKCLSCHVADAVIADLKLHVVTVGEFQTVIKGSYPKPLGES